MSSSPGLRSGPLAMPMSRVSCSPCSASTSAATATCPLPPSIDEQVRRRILAGDDPRDAPGQRLAHRRVVVAAGGRASTLKRRYSAGLHRQPVEDHARRDGALAHRVRDVEALDPLRRRAAAPSAACSAASRSSCVAFCASFCAIANCAFCIAIASHTRRSPPGLATICTLLPRLRRQHARRATSSASAFRRDDRRRHRPLDVVLREERRTTSAIGAASACCGK